MLKRLIHHLAAAVFLVSLCFLPQCTSKTSGIVPELILDVPDEVKPAIAGILLRIQGADMYPFEIDLAQQEREMVIPTGKDRTIHALVTNAQGRLIASGVTVCTISRSQRKVEIHLALPPQKLTLAVVSLPHNKVALRWNKYIPQADTVAFATYKLYHSPVNEVSQIANLVQNITQKNDTLFMLNDEESKDGYYRLYIYEKSGAFNGSATVLVGTANAPDSMYAF